MLPPRGIFVPARVWQTAYQNQVMLFHLPHQLFFCTQVFLKQQSGMTFNIKFYIQNQSGPVEKSASCSVVRRYNK